MSRFKNKYQHWMKVLVSTAAATLRKGQDRYMMDFYTRLKRLLPNFKVGDLAQQRQRTAKAKVRPRRILEGLCNSPAYDMSICFDITEYTDTNAARRSSEINLWVRFTVREINGSAQQYTAP